jgi:glycosyltransferase involved in cell wall biosynthesis
MRWLIRRAIRHATRIVTVSDSVRDDIVKALRVDPRRIVRIHHGVAPRFRPAAPDAIRAFRERRGLARPYLLFVGNLEPRKNLPGLLRAFREVRRRHAGPLDLVVTGQVAWLSRPLLRDLGTEDLGESVRTTGFLPPGDLPVLYSGAEAFVFPTLGEGFGLPVLEAMACGTPVITSNLSCLPEVAGDAAVLCDPHAIDSISEAILSILTDPGRREDLVRRGLARAAGFTWERTARETLAAYAAAVAAS